MSNASFRSVFMVASCAGAALGCYLVSLRVASERSALEDVETKIVLAQRDIRLLQTEIGTRGRLAQLERWNVKVLALSAPSADQFLKGGFELAKMTTPEHKSAIEAPVVLASAPAPSENQSRQAPGSGELLHQASLKTSSPSLAEELAKAQPVRKPAAPPSGTAKPSALPAKVSAKPAVSQLKTASTGQAKAVAKVTAKADASAKAASRPRTAGRDPLAPLPQAKVKVASAAKPTREPARKQ